MSATKQMKLHLNMLDFLKTFSSLPLQSKMTLIYFLAQMNFSLNICVAHASSKFHINGINEKKSQDKRKFLSHTPSFYFFRSLFLSLSFALSLYLFSHVFILEKKPKSKNCTQTFILLIPIWLRKREKKTILTTPALWTIGKGGFGHEVKVVLDSVLCHVCPCYKRNKRVVWPYQYLWKRFCYWL